MKTIVLLKNTSTVRLLLCMAVVVCFLGIGLYMVLQSRAAVNYPYPTSRDMYRWPLSRYAPQNMPIGKNANYQPANITKNHYAYVTADDDIIYYNPNAPLQDVYYNGASWSGNSRCGADGGVMHKIKAPADFYIPDAQGAHGRTPNHSASFLDENNKVVESQPLTHCPGGSFTTLVLWDGEGKGGGSQRYDLNSAKFGGAHGGSGISGAGLAIKLGELTPNKPPRHAIGIEMHAATDYSCSGGCNRWPAPAADNYAGGGYRGSNPKVKPGALLALKQGQADSLGLTTEPGKMLAWTMENYGAYIVDDAYWETFQIPVEFSPHGDYKAEFKNTWGFDFNSGSGPWVEDVKKIFENTWVVDNNAANAIGGGGDPLQCYAPPFSNGTDAITVNPNGAVTEPSDCGGGVGPTPTNNPTPTPSTSPTPNGDLTVYDIDNNGTIGVGDLSRLIQDYPRQNGAVIADSPADFNKSGRVDINDLSTLLRYWGQST